MHHLCVLIADNNYQDRRMLGEIIAQIDRQAPITVLSNGLDTLRFLQSAPGEAQPNLIFLDYDLPGSNAVRILEYLASAESYQHALKVIWSRLTAINLWELCADRGAQRYLSKTLWPSSLKRAVAHLIWSATIQQTIN